MAVPEENYDASELFTLKSKASVVKASRAKNGGWHLIVDVEVETRLPDGRLVTTWEEVRLRGRADRKPRPNPTWLHKKREAA